MKRIGAALFCLIAFASKSADAAPSSTTGALIPMAFSGLTLAQAEDAGIALSPDVAAARARLGSARAQLAQARYSIVPQGFASFSESPQGGFGASTISTHQTSLGIQSNVGDVLAYPATVSQAQAATRAAAADESVAERTERIAAASAYFASLKASSIRAAREDAVRLAQAELDAARVRFGAGDAPRIDVVRAEVALAQADAAAERARADDANAREALEVETGASDASLGAVAPGAPPALPQLALDPVAAAAAALHFRPEVASAQAGLEAARRALTSASIGLIPPVTVTDGYATGVDGGQRVSGRTVTAQVTVPIPFASAQRIAQASTSVAVAQAQLLAAQRRVTLDASAAARSLAAADRAAAATLRARDEARAELDAVEIGYRTGASSSLDVAQAQATYEQAQVDELSTVYDEAVANAVFDVETGR